MVSEDFKTIYCTKFKCPPGEFEKRVLLQCLYRRATLIGRLIWLLNPGYFHADLELIEEMMGLTSSAKARDIITFSGNSAQGNAFWRWRLKIRMSRGRLLNLVRSVLPPESPAPAPSASDTSLFNATSSVIVHG